jgi:hypothetical protein
MQTIMRTCLLASLGIFALIGWLFTKWIPWKADNPVSKSMNLGFMTKSFYPAMLALMVGGAVVIVGGVVAIRSLRKYFSSVEEADVVESAEPAT